MEYFAPRSLELVDCTVELENLTRLDLSNVLALHRDCDPGICSLHARAASLLGIAHGPAPARRHPRLPNH
ncbi:hypothetical protein IU501_03920 [Nocardia otitidiscaviarum]|uniref:hypothetical protein n=1 Tax=Nocardia otitidiscaviarum TaxID=1823 RepID=UPI0004A6E515|nr:hypothetical protein [Nocardia otitidiscaviarum]MBF6132139.1 hypothetical protein [Nocardia otitidiscaviarum]MBF6483269.1 hypothetical protein [Nocardia otitidiscaviarum]